MPLPGEQVWRRRACDPLERDGNSLEGALGPRPRQGLAREGASNPPSEAEPRSRGRPTLERGGFVPGRRRTPRAERGSTRGWLGRLFDGPWVCGFVLRVCLGSFAFIFHEFKRVSSGCLGTLMAVPDSSPRASMGVPVRIPQMLTLVDGTFFPLVADAIP
jgi:hypothetical protein